MKIVTQLLSVNKGKEQDATIMFACSLTDYLEIVKNYVDEVRIKFWIEDAAKDVIIGNVVGTVTSSSGSDPYKFKIKSPGSENIKTSQLSTLCGKEIELNIDIDV